MGQLVGRLFRVAGVRRAGMPGEVATEQSKHEARRSHRRQGGREVRQARGKGGMRKDQHEIKSAARWGRGKKTL